MYIKLQNVGAIDEATVDLTGLSVIAGKNGAGKSTIGKNIYTIIKAIQEQGTIVKKTTNEVLDWACKNIYFLLQGPIARAANAGKLVKSDADLLESLFQRGVFEVLLKQYSAENNLAEAVKLIEARKKSVDEFSDVVDVSTKQNTKHILDTIKNRFMPMSPETVLKEALVIMYQKVFDGQVTNVESHLTSKIDFGGVLLFSISNNADTLPLSERLSVEYTDPKISQKVFQDVTFVETPLILQLENSKELESLPHYWQDLFPKTSVAGNAGVPNEIIRDALSNISDALGGSLEWNANKRRYEFVKRNFSKGANVSINNAASGEKVLGIFQQLALNGMFGPDKITILDEPENHLHPQWLAVLAEVLIKLALANCPILIASHSPDFLQALRFYANKHKFTDLKFYLANSDVHTIEDKTGKESEIFDNLAKPINDIFDFSVNEALA